MNTFIENKIEGQRFKTGIEFQKDLLTVTRSIQDRMLQNLPSNYTRDRNTNLAEFYRAIAEEFGRLQYSATDISNDKFHDEIRIEYLFTILGDLLFLGEKSINESMADTEYREFLIKVRNGYIGGSRPDNIEDTVSDIVGLPVTLKEIYQSLRLSKTSYTLKDTHKMFFDIAMDNVTSSSDIGTILGDLSFFLDLLKPAHVIYDTRLIWTEDIDKRGDCIPKYDMSTMQETVYYGENLYVVTYAASSVYLTAVETGEEGWETGTISAINTTNKIINLTNNRILVYTDSSRFYRRNASGSDTRIDITSFSVGDVIKYYATKDSASSSEIIETDWNYTGTISSINTTDQVITLQSSSKLVYSNDTFVYTRDGNGEHRITISDLISTNEIIFKGYLYTESFNFYNTPEAVSDNNYKQFDQTVIDKPYFQKNVKKVFDTRDGLAEGYHVIVEDGVAKVIEIDGQFYSREDSKNYVERMTYRYELFIDNAYKAQFSITEPQESISTSEAKIIFINQFGYTDLENPFTDYEIKIIKTGRLHETTGSATVETIDDTTEFCDADAECTLVPAYEDMRKYWTWPEVRLTSGFIVFYQAWDVQNDPGEYNVPAYYAISSDPNQYVMPLLPVLDSSGDPASASDLVVYVNGLKVDDAVATLNPWTGIVTLNFLPPFNSTVRVDYYYADRYPEATAHRTQIATNIQQVLSDTDISAEYTIIGANSTINKLLWPFDVDNDLLGDDLDYQMDLFPILTNQGKLATASDITVSLGTLIESGEINVTTGSALVTDNTADFSSASSGDSIIITAVNYLDNTLVYTVDAVIDAHTLRMSSVFPNLSDGLSSYPYKILRYSEVSSAIQSVRSLLGHVRLNFIPPSGSYLKFDYYYTYHNRKYVMQPDQLDGYIPDTVFNAYNNYTIIPDIGPDYNYRVPYTADESVRKIGYRYRVFNLSNSSVLNSSDTLPLNYYDKKGSQASFKNRDGKLNDYELMFSPEYLTDTSQDITLNDKYLERNIPATTQLHEGIPPFVKTFSDDAHFVELSYADETDTYEGQTGSGKDLQAGFTIITPDKSGDIDYNKVCDYTQKRNINLHSDLKMVEFPDSGSSVPLSTISEGSRILPISTTMIEQYYPNRELRIDDYLDFINKVPEDIKTGTVKVLNSSRTIKSYSVDMLRFRKGDKITLKNVAVIKGKKEGLDIVTDVVYEDQNYIILKIYDHETALLNKPFIGTSAAYSYELQRDTIYNVDVLTAGAEPMIIDGITNKYGNLQRRLVFNGSLEHTYSLPITVLQNLPGYDDPSSNFSTSFTDPDVDPYPRNPDNPNINGLPTGDPSVLFTNYTGQETKVPLSSEVIKADGYNILGETNMAGLTGPSGAVDLGLTGPVGVPNPRTPSEDDDPNYNIPSGESGIYLSYSESEYRVQWRNWDQDMEVVTLGSTGISGVLVEEPVNMLDDIGEGIRKSFWDVNKGAAGDTGIINMYFFGTVIESSKSVEASVPKATYTDGMIELTPYQANAIEAAYRNGINPATLYPEFNLNDANYEHRQLIIRELLHDNSFKITEVRQYEPI